MTDAGEGRHVPVGQLLGQQPQGPSRWRAVAQWRDWSLPVKLAAVTLVPIVIVVALGVTTINSEVARSDSYERVDRFVALNSEIRTLVDGLQQERTLTAGMLTEGSGRGSPELDAARGMVDGAVAPMTEAATEAVALDNAVSGPNREVNDQLARLASVREQVATGALDSAQTVDAYSEITGALLKLDNALVAGITDQAIGGTPSALHDLQVAKEEASASQAVVSYGIARGTLPPSELTQLRTSEVRFTDRLADFRSAATPQQRQDYDSTVDGPNFAAREGTVQAILGQSEDSAGEVTDALRTVPPQQWTDNSSAVTGHLGDVSGRFGDQLSSTSAGLVDEASSSAGLRAVLLFVALVLTAAVVFLITRQLLSSLRVLRTSAMSVADEQLPSAVRHIQEGGTHSGEVQPVPVTSKDEVGEVARAFDAVHNQALRLAAEQAVMRSGYGSVFVNLSRRSQSLVQRQLQMIERLERDEEDSEQLATLFQLDHLATRMRRNNENLMVLSGSEPGRRSSQPVSTADVLRAAVSEIEQYQRVVVQPPPDARVVGYVAGDLMRLLAELLDNATAFSAPETQVTVATRILDNGALSVDVLDKGIGMNESEVAEANSRLGESGSVDLATSRRMGLFVVGRLASRHRIEVALSGGKDIVGVRATVVVPADLVVGAAGPAGQSAQPQQQESVQPGSGLPRRQPPVNGSSKPAAMPSSADDSADVARAAHGGADDSATAGNQHGGAGLAGPSPSLPNGLAHQPAPPTEVEISGTALFNTPPEPAPQPGGDDQQGPQPQPPAATGTDPPATATPQTGPPLFRSDSSALSDWWSTATSGEQEDVPAQSREPEPQPEPDQPENTPIFDETLSAWFRTEEPGGRQTAAEPESAAAASNWQFEADERWRTVQVVSESAPSSYTDAGLPRRQRGEQLLPGSATTDEAGSSPRSGSAVGAAGDLPSRDPADVRGRLSSFQQGVNLARQHGQESSSAVTSEPPAGREQPTAGPGPSESPARAPETGPHTDQWSHGAQARPATDSTAEWTFDTDENWRTVQEVTESEPSSHTAAGLPIRRRGEQLLPGSAGPSSDAPPNTPERDPQDVRGRLSSFQQGVRRGRHRTAQPTEGNHEKLEGE